MKYINFYYSNIQDCYNFSGDYNTKNYLFNPDDFLTEWEKGKIVPVIDFDDFSDSVRIDFEGDVESLYILCFYIYTYINDSYFLKLKPTAKEISNELINMGKIKSFCLKDDAGKTISINTSYIIKEVLKAIEEDDNSNNYEVDELVPVNNIANNLYLQSKFAMNLAFFFNQYFQIKRKKDSLVSTEEQRLILKLLYLFKLSPVELTDSRFRQFKMCFDKFKFVTNLTRLPENKDGKRIIVPVTMLKWKQWKNGKIDFQSVSNERLDNHFTVSF